MNVDKVQVRMFCDMSLRELVDGMNNQVIVMTSAGEVRMGLLKGVVADTRNRIRAINVDEGDGIVRWDDWTNTVFVD